MYLSTCPGRRATATSAIWLGGAAVLGQSITPGLLVAFVMYISRFFEPIRDLSMRYDAMMSTMASGERILDHVADLADGDAEGGSGASGRDPGLGGYEALLWAGTSG